MNCSQFLLAQWRKIFWLHVYLSVRKSGSAAYHTAKKQPTELAIAHSCILDEISFYSHMSKQGRFGEDEFTYVSDITNSN